MAGATLSLIPRAEETILIRNAPWELYLQALDEIVDRPAIRVTYLAGCLQIMSVSAKHDALNRALARIVDIVALEAGMDARPLGSATYKRDDLRAGFEPDTGFYFTHAGRTRAMVGNHLEANDPPPELIIEIDITSPSLPRLPVFAAAGVGEVWRFHRERLTFHLLRDDRYVESALSGVFPFLDSETLTALLQAESSMPFPEWHRLVASTVSSLRGGRPEAR